MSVRKTTTASTPAVKPMRAAKPAPAVAKPAIAAKSAARPAAKLAAKLAAMPIDKVITQPAAAPTVALKPVEAAKPSTLAKAMKLAKPRKPVKPAKPPKLRQKPVRDSFTMPEADFALIATLKARAVSAKRETKKSELLRAGLHALAALDTPTLVAALGQLDPVKIGRPKKGH